MNGVHCFGGMCRSHVHPVCICHWHQSNENIQPNRSRLSFLDVSSSQPIQLSTLSLFHFNVNCDNIKSINTHTCQLISIACILYRRRVSRLCSSRKAIVMRQPPANMSCHTIELFEEIYEFEFSES